MKTIVIDQNINTMTVLGTYGDYVKAMTDTGWGFADNESPHIITHSNTDMVSTHSTAMGNSRGILEITCPDDKEITICGRSHADINHPPHFFSLRCRSSSGENLALDTEFTIIKNSIKGAVPLFCQIGDSPVLYSELSQTVGERFKEKGGRHRFPKGIILYPTETLIFRVINPNIDIVKTELSMQADIWENKKAQEE